MRSIIGLFISEAVVEPTIVRLKEAGIAGEQISILSNPKTINALLGCDPACVIKNYTAWGVVIGIGVYAIFGAAAAICQCNLMQYGQVYGIGAFLGAVLAGTFVGGIIGVLVGAGEAEKDTHLYVQGIRTGGKVITIKVLDEDVDRIQYILAMENVTGVKVLQLEGT
jgi:hypothetical protein